MLCEENQILKRLNGLCVRLILLFCAISVTSVQASKLGGLNSLGIKMVPISDTVLLAAHETRVSDFRVYVEEGGVEIPAPFFEQGPNHPVVNISWEDAQRFCAWLTKREHRKGVISKKQYYRLPTESEWLEAAGLQGKREQSYIEERELAFTWGRAWPPPLKAGNFSQELGVDQFENTAPVSSFRPNTNGFYDLSGNVWEWCEDTFEGATDIRVLKGGSWRMREPSRLALNRRIGNACGLRLPTYGFRIALALRASDP